MTLWTRVSLGVYLCGAVGVAAILGAVLSQSNSAILQGIGGLFAVLVYMFGVIVFTLGLLIVVAGLVSHLRNRSTKRAPDA